MRARWLTLCLALGFAAGLTMPSPARAESYASGNVNVLRTGWNADSFGIVLDTPVQNPGNCPIADGYVSEAGQPGYDTYYDAALAAYRLGTPITVVIDPGGCVMGRPKIMGINPAPLPPPPPQHYTVLLRVIGWVQQWSERRFSDVPVIGTFTGHGTDCSHGGSPSVLPGPGSGPGVVGVAGWGQVEGNGHPDANSDSCVSWVARFGFDFDMTPFTSVPGIKTIDKAVLRYDEKQEPSCATLIYTQGGFLVDSDIPCWSSGDGAPEDKPDGCVALRVPAGDWRGMPIDQPLPITDMTFPKADRRGAWDVTDLFRQRMNPGLEPPPEAGGPMNMGWGYALVGTPLDTGNLDAEDNTRCSSYISDIRIELSFTVLPDQGPVPGPH
ncbi:MAG TPA: hypothetical protein VMT54_02570 [Candidatus Cybelea sp.]|nr:hypothetical protein [Candidatus Cybelea sp.]